MRALVCHEFGPPETMRVETLPDPEPGPGQVLVRVHAAGVNFTDVLSTGGRSQLGRKLPMIPGVEAAGVVVRTGPGVSRLNLGDRVLCQLMAGGMADHVVADDDEAVRIPDTMPLEDAACFYIASFTTWHALVTRAGLARGESLLVLGAGSGAGLAAVQMGKALGATVTAAASSEAKLDLARSAGADHVVSYPAGPLDSEAQRAFAGNLRACAQSRHRATIGEIASLRGGDGFDVIYDGVGGSYAEPAVRSLAWEGRYLSVGFAAGVPAVSLGPLLFKNASLFGIQPSEPGQRLPGRIGAPLDRMFRWYEDGLLRPHISERYRLDNAPAALRRLIDRKAVGRIVLTME